MSGLHLPLSLQQEQELDAMCDQFEAAWKQGQQPVVEDYVAEAPEALKPLAIRELCQIELHYRLDPEGNRYEEHDLRELHPGLVSIMATAHPSGPSDAGVNRLLYDTVRSSGSAEVPSEGLHIRCPHCSNPVELLADAPVDDVSCTNCGSQFSLVDDEKSDGSGQSLKTLGRFELLARLGVGGFGTVWKAHDTQLDRIVAVKIPRKGNLSALEVEQFLREARAAAQLRHPNIVPVFEVGREQGTIFIVSEFVRGVSLADWMKERRRSAQEIASVCAVITDALTEAHAAGVVHRDLKPSNVMLDISGRPRLMDFGLAKREVGEVTMTLEGFVVGTPAYMSPEQARGEGHWTDRRTDIYSLGVMMFHMLTDELPFRGSAAVQIQARLNSDPPSPRGLDPSVPRDLATICLKCMELDPNRRYSTAKDVGDELRRYLSGKPVLARPLPTAVRAWRWIKRHPAVSAALALTVVLAIGGPTAAILLENQRREILNRLDERDELVKSREAERIDLQGEIQSLKQRMAMLASGFPDQVLIEPWRLDLVRSLLEGQYDNYKQQAADARDPVAAASTHHALGDLTASVGQNDQAVEHYREAAQLLAERTSPDALQQRVEVGLALAQLTEAQGNNEAAREALDDVHEALTMLGDDGTRADVAVDRLAATMLEDAVEVDEGRNPSERLNDLASRTLKVDQWPSDANQLPALRDRLLDRRPK